MNRAAARKARSFGPPLSSGVIARATARLSSTRNRPSTTVTLAGTGIRLTRPSVCGGAEAKAGAARTTAWASMVRAKTKQNLKFRIAGIMRPPLRSGS